MASPRSQTGPSTELHLCLTGTSCTSLLKLGWSCECNAYSCYSLFISHVTLVLGNSLQPYPLIWKKVDSFCLSGLVLR